MRTIEEAVRAIRSQLMLAPEALDALIEQQVIASGDGHDTDAADEMTPSAKRPRNPFQHPQAKSHGYIGPGPKGMIHIPSASPWHCSGSNYQYVCHRTLPDGSTQTRQLNYDPARVSQRNADYREFARARTKLQQAKRWPEPLPLDKARSLYPTVAFKSHF